MFFMFIMLHTIHSATKSQHADFSKNKAQTLALQTNRIHIFYSN